MAEIVFAAAMSHSPLMNFPVEGDQAQIEHFKKAISETERRLQSARPDVVLLFGPDHFRSLFYDLMPAFLIGTERVAGWGDWNTPVGPFKIHSALANHILNVTTDTFDPAFSLELKLDHGSPQPLQRSE